jgi:hypothetical protein
VSATKDDNAQRAWVQRVLGVRFEPAVSSPTGVSPLALWRDAKDIVDSQISALQGAFRTVDDSLAQAVADRGLAGLTKDLLVGLQAALFEYDAADASARPKTVTALRAAIEQLRHFLNENRALPLLENNPFGITVTIRGSLGSALDQIEAAVSA